MRSSRNSLHQLLGKEKPTARSLLAVGSGDLLKSALLHPFPSSRRHVIRVDMVVPVDVIRVAFWMRVIMKLASCPLRVLSGDQQGKFKIAIASIDISGCPRLRVGLLHLRCKLPQKRDKGSRGHRKCPIAPVGKPKFPVELGVLQVD